MPPLNAETIGSSTLQLYLVTKDLGWLKKVRNKKSQTESSTYVWMI